MNAPALRQISLTIVIALVLAGASAWSDALTPGIVLFLVMVVIMAAIRAPYMANSAPVASRQREGREKLLVQIVGAGMMYLPAIAIATPLLNIAAYPNPVWLVVLGVILAAFGIWLFWRSHADLGRNWSPVLELRESHGLVTNGVYARVRHPMYSAILLITAAQAAFIGNWIAGPAGLIAFTILYIDRVGAEEKMMAQRFGTDWTRYVARTGRLLPMAAPNEPDSIA